MNNLFQQRKYYRNVCVSVKKATYYTTDYFSDTKKEVPQVLLVKAETSATVKVQNAQKDNT